MTCIAFIKTAKDIWFGTGALGCAVTMESHLPGFQKTNWSTAILPMEFVPPSRIRTENFGSATPCIVMIFIQMFLQVIIRAGTSLSERKRAYRIE
jgi:hypothetical protein